MFVFSDDFHNINDSAMVNVDDFLCEPVDLNETVAVVLPSSGTTGMPKGVEITQMNVFASFHVYYM